MLIIGILLALLAHMSALKNNEGKYGSDYWNTNLILDGAAWKPLLGILTQFQEQ